jgi:hypothetical protein
MIQPSAAEPTVKMIGANGQISLGKENAGRQVLVEEREPGVWVIREAVVIPHNELFLHTPEARASLSRAMVAEEGRQPQETDLDALGAELKGKAHGGKKATAKRKA